MHVDISFYWFNYTQGSFMWNSWVTEAFWGDFDLGNHHEIQLFTLQKLNFEKAVVRVWGAFESKPLLACSPDLSGYAIVCPAQFLGVDQALGTCAAAARAPDAQLKKTETQNLSKNNKIKQSGWNLGKGNKIAPLPFSRTGVVGRPLGMRFARL